MLESPSIQATLKRLIDAEEEARATLKAAEVEAEAALAAAHEQAGQMIEAVRRDAAARRQARIEDAEAKGAAELKQRLDQAEREAGEFERAANARFHEATQMVVDWVTGRRSA